MNYQLTVLMANMKYTLAIVALMLMTSGVMAQPPAKETVHVVTKTVEKDFSYHEGYEVNIEGEKADISVTTWAKNEVSVLIEITAKHSDVKIAEADLDNIRYLAERVKNKIYVRNYRADKGYQSAANLEIRYTIVVPEECPVYVKNYFGIANISNLTNRLRVYGEYSQIDMNNIEGLLDIRTRFGDIIGEKIGGNVTINARRSDVTLRDITGSYTINAQYGTLRLHPIAGLTVLNVNAEKSEVFLYENGLDKFGYLLTTTHGEMDTPPDIRSMELESTPEVKRIQIKPGTEISGQITVSVTFGDVHLERERERIRVN